MALSREDIPAPAEEDDDWGSAEVQRRIRSGKRTVMVGIADGVAAAEKATAAGGAVCEDYRIGGDGSLEVNSIFANSTSGGSREPDRIHTA